MPSLTTKYLGLQLDNPIVAAATPMTFTEKGISALQEAGVGAIVLSSIFEEQIRSDVSEIYESLEDDMSPHALAYLHADLPMQIGPESYLNRVRELRKIAKVPLIASVNCLHAAQWVTFARKIEATGVDAIELNVYDIPVDPFVTSAEIEDEHIKLVESVLRQVTIPVAVKLSPYYTSPPHLARRLDKLGINGLVLFNRFLQPDIDVSTLKLDNTPNLSRPESMRLPLRWVALLRNLVSCDLGLTGGVHNANGVIRAILAGADVVCPASAILMRGNAEPVAEMLDGLRDWMTAQRHEDIGKFRGSLSERNLTDRKGFERSQYVRLLSEQKSAEADD